MNPMYRWLAVPALLFSAALAQAAEPSSGTISTDSPTLSYSSGPFAVSNPSGTAGDIQCNATQPCDFFDLTVDLPANYAQTNPADVIRVSTSWANPGEDYDIYLLDANGSELRSSAGSTNPEVFEFPAGAGQQQYQIRIVPYAVAGGTTTTTVELLSNAPPPPQAEATGLPPRFYYFQSPDGLADGAGEPTVGYNPATGHAMFIANVEVDRLSFAGRDTRTDVLGNPLPASCEAEWTDKRFPLSATTLDPILQTEQSVGRTFQSQLTGANSIFAYTDDDGDTWTPAQQGPPNGGADHQTVGTGPYSPNFPGVHLADYAVYYCSQSIAAAFCARSDDGGQTFGPGVEIFNPAVDCNGDIGALHGHVQVAPDGTVYVPFGGCGDRQAVSVSEDSGLTWTVKTVPETSPGNDPGVGVARDGTVYFCYVNGSDKQPRVAVSHDKGDTWINHFNIGASQNIASAVFPTAVAGDGDRAACAFLGTQEQGNAEAEDFKGVWYPYVATTYDGGVSWHTVNVAPNDPVQGWGGICLSGTTCGNNRNLLDFNDIIIDDIGRVMFAHADGCVGPCVDDPTVNTFTDNGVLALQSGGRTLLSAFDGGRFNADAAIAPEAACARDDRSRRTVAETRVVWNAPDDGGSPITRYRVLRATDPAGPYTEVGAVPGAKTAFVDGSADPAVEKYYYRVIAENAQGAAPVSNTIELPITIEEVADTCQLPGQVVLNPGTGTTGTGGGGPDEDVVFVAVAEPAGFEGNLVVTMKIADFTAGSPPEGHLYTVEFGHPGAREGSTLYIAYDSTAENTQSSPFTYGSQIGGTVSCCDFKDDGVLDERSGFDPDGTLRLVMPLSLIPGKQVGDSITVNATRVRVGARDGSSRDFFEAGAGYTIRGTADCPPPGVLLAFLDGEPTRGQAPLDVRFTVRGQPSEGETLQSWRLDFGDGQSAEGSFDGQPSVNVEHRYVDNGAYQARLVVVDSSGAESTNNALKLIEVGVAGSAPAAAGPEARFGGLGAGLLIVLGMAAVCRRRSPFGRR